MAYRGFREIPGARGVPSLVFHIVDGLADLPPIASQAIGNQAFGIAGADDGKTWEVRKLSTGLEWHEVGGGIPAGDATITGDLQVDGSITTDGDIDAPTGAITGGSLRSVTAVTFKAGDPNETTLGGSFTAARTIELPDASGTLISRDGSRTTQLPVSWVLDLQRNGAAGTLRLSNSGTGPGALGEISATGGLGLFDSAPPAAQVANVAALAAFSDPPTPAEMGNLRALVNALRDCVRPSTGVGMMS